MLRQAAQHNTNGACNAQSIYNELVALRAEQKRTNLLLAQLLTTLKGFEAAVTIALEPCHRACTWIALSFDKQSKENNRHQADIIMQVSMLITALVTARGTLASACQPSRLHSAWAAVLSFICSMPLVNCTTASSSSFLPHRLIWGPCILRHALAYCFGAAVLMYWLWRTATRQQYSSPIVGLPQNWIPAWNAILGPGTNQDSRDSSKALGTGSAPRSNPLWSPPQPGSGSPVQAAIAEAWGSLLLPGLYALPALYLMRGSVSTWVLLRVGWLWVMHTSPAALPSTSLHQPKQHYQGQGQGHNSTRQQQLQQQQGQGHISTQQATFICDALTSLVMPIAMGVLPLCITRLASAAWVACTVVLVFTLHSMAHSRQAGTAGACGGGASACSDGAGCRAK